MDRSGPSIGFIGIGVLGKGLALALAARGYRVIAAHSRRPASAQWLTGRIPDCQTFGSAQELADTVDLVFITTQDANIEPVVSALAWRPDQGVVHCSGAQSTGILRSAADQGALTGSFHPFQTFAGIDQPEQTADRMKGVIFAVTGEGWVGDMLRRMAGDLGGRPVSISDQDRPLYHAAAVLGCGFLVPVFQAAIEVWRAMGFSTEEALEALYPLAHTTLETVANNGVEASVTGPIVRGDADTIRAHLEAIFQRVPNILPLYGALAEASLPLATGKGVGPDLVTALQELIDHYTGVQ